MSSISQEYFWVAVVECLSSMSAYQGVRSSIPGLVIWISEIGNLPFPSHDMTERLLKQRKSLEQPDVGVNFNSLFTALTCSFESGFCGWYQSSTDDFNWWRNRGSTPSYDTGPDSDHTTGTGQSLLCEKLKLCSYQCWFSMASQCGQKSVFSHIWNSFSNIWNSFSNIWNYFQILENNFKY